MMIVTFALLEPDSFPIGSLGGAVVVGGLGEDIRIVYFQRAADLAGADQRIEQYRALSPHLKAEFVDPYTMPSRAREYDVKGPWPIIVVERGARRERAASDSEQDLTNAVVKVTREGQKTVCFVEGEGEASPCSCHP